MSLKKYHAKRDFTKTKEPIGKKVSQSDKPLRFYIQKHWARRLHYDLRLELNGVLVSFAVPKGPSLNPKDKRLAVHVEDHPLEYGNFEGTIPKGEYGAGEVIVWDKGTYAPVGSTSRKEDEILLKKQLKKGEIKFILSGKKLKGAFLLIKLKRNDPQDKNWLLIKKEGEYTEKRNNVISVNFKHKKIAYKKMPHHIKPMLCTLVEKSFNDKDWIFEIKWDGYRAIAEVDHADVLLYSRNFLNFNDHFPEVVSELKKLGSSTVLDGELVILDKTGKSNFQLLQNYLSQEKINGALKYVIFDILYYNGEDLRTKTLLERKTILKTLLTERKFNYLQYGDFYPEKGLNFFKQAKKLDMEGIIAKKKDSPYLSERTKYWLKIKASHRQEVVIGGFTAPKGSRQKLGALLVGVYEKNNLVLVGRLGGGFNQKSLNEVYQLLKPLVQKTPPFVNVPNKYKVATWVKPKLVCEMVFREWTKEGIARQPIFKGMRIDKDPTTIHREKPK